MDFRPTSQELSFWANAPAYLRWFRPKMKPAQRWDELLGRDADIEETETQAEAECETDEDCDPGCECSEGECECEDASVGDFDPDQPRDEGGKWTDGGGGGGKGGKGGELTGGKKEIASRIVKELQSNGNHMSKDMFQHLAATHMVMSLTKEANKSVAHKVAEHIARMAGYSHKESRDMADQITKTWAKHRWSVGSMSPTSAGDQTAEFLRAVIGDQPDVEETETEAEAACETDEDCDPDCECSEEGECECEDSVAASASDQSDVEETETEAEAACESDEDCDAGCECSEEGECECEDSGVVGQDFSEDQPRDETGKWTAGAGGGTSGEGHAKTNAGLNKHAELHHKMIHAVTEYDRKESTKRGYNPYALPQYMQRVQEISADIGKGADPREAITTGFTGRLVNHVLKAAGLAAERRGGGGKEPMYDMTKVGATRASGRAMVKALSGDASGSKRLTAKSKKRSQTA